jgi:hypothetical protein
MVVDKKAVGRRLKALRAVAWTDHKGFCAKCGIGLADWNNYEAANMLLPPNVGGKLVENIPGLTLDWLYLGRTNGLDGDLQRKLAAAEAGKAVVGIHTSASP